MRLGVSSAAAPDLTLPALVDACHRRGLTALELVPGHAHGIDAGAGVPGTREPLRSARMRGITIAALGTSGGGDPEATLDLCGRIGIPVLADLSDPALPEILKAARTLGAHGGQLLLLSRSSPEQVSAGIELLRDHRRSGLAWEIDPETDEREGIPAILGLARDHLRYVRLRGGGPESLGQTGLGVGALIARLALARFAGPLILTPTTPAYRKAWGAWLGRGGGWGCGSKTADPSLVSL